MKAPIALMVLSIGLAGGGGILAATALSSSKQAPTKTVTISVATGPKGDTGPPGPPGSVECNPGYSFGNLVINHPGGQTTIQTCIKD